MPKVGERFVVERGDVEQVMGILQVIGISCGRTFSFRAKSKFCDKTLKEETHFNNCVVFHLNCLSFQLLRIPANSSQLLLKRFPSRISGMVNLFCLFREQGLHLGHKSYLISLVLWMIWTHLVDDISILADNWIDVYNVYSKVGESIILLLQPPGELFSPKPEENRVT